jgi:hypothetical protein
MNIELVMQVAVQQAALILTGLALAAAVGTALLGTTVLYLQRRVR